MIKDIWSAEKYTTLKSCAAVVLLGAAVAAGLLIIRLVGEKRSERFLKILFFLRRRQPHPGLTAEVLAADNHI